MQGKQTCVPAGLPRGWLRGDELRSGCAAREELWEAVSDQSPVTGGDRRRLFEYPTFAFFYLALKCVIAAALDAGFSDEWLTCFGGGGFSQLCW